MDLVQDVLDITSSYCFFGAQQDNEKNCIQNAKEETHRHLLSQEYNEKFSSPEFSFQFLQDNYLIPLDFHPDIQNSLERIHSKLKDTTPHSTQSYQETLKFLHNEKRYLQQIGTSQQIDGLHQMTGLVGISVALQSSQMWFDLFTKSENPAADGMHAIMDTAVSVSGSSKSNTGVPQQVPDAIANMDSGTAMTMLQGILSMIGQKGKDTYFDGGSGSSSNNGNGENIDSNAILNLVGSAVAGNVGGGNGGGGSITENINLSVLQKVLSLVNGGIMPQQHTQQTQQGQSQGGGLFTSKVLIADYTAALAAVLAGIKKNNNGSGGNNNNNSVFPSQQHTTYNEYDDDDDGRSYYGSGSSIGMEQYSTREDEQGTTTTNEYYDIMDTTHSSITTTTTTSNAIDTPSLIQKGLIASIPASAGALFWSALSGDLQFGSSNNNNNNNNSQSSGSSNYHVNIDDDTIST